jgi:hypothetical protein
MAAGRSYEYVDEMTLADVELIFDYWNIAPPANETLAIVHRIKPAARRMSLAQVRDMKPPEGCLSISELKNLAKRAGLPG